MVMRGSVGSPASDEICGQSSADTYCAHRFYERGRPHSRCRRSRSIVWAYVCRRSSSPHGFPDLFTRLDAPRDAAHMPSTLDRPSIADPVLTTVAGVAMDPGDEPLELPERRLAAPVGSSSQ